MKKLIVLLCLLLTCLQSCKNVGKYTNVFKGNSPVDIVYDSKEGIINVKFNTIKNSSYDLCVGNINIRNGYIVNETELNILSLIKEKPETWNALALVASERNGEIPFTLKVSDILDTVLIYRLKPNIRMQEVISFTGIGAKVLSKASSGSIDEDLRRWLYRNKVVLNDQQYESFRAYYVFLSETKTVEYVTKEIIPVVHNLSNAVFNVSCDIQADYYAIVACHDQGFIDSFVENAVISNYDGLSQSKNALTCILQNIDQGFLCVTLVAINKDYSYKQVPLALIAIDNLPPSSKSYIEDYNSIIANIRKEGIKDKTEKSNNPNNPKVIQFGNNYRVLIPNNAPELIGFGNVAVEHWDGNGLECNVTFKLAFSGDCKSITIRREGNLCYPNLPLGNYFSPEEKVFYAKDYSGSHRFSWKMHFDDGDNEIPFTLEDYHGNKRQDKVVVRAEFVRSSDPLIENNIYNY